RTILGGGDRTIGDAPVPALSAMVSRPGALAFADDGALFVTEEGTSAILRLDPRGHVERVAGGGDLRGEGVLARRAALDLPRGVAVGPDGSLYVAETAGHRVRRIDPSGRISTLAGRGEAGSGGDGGPAN